jgi:hypothetical protein
VYRPYKPEPTFDLMRARKTLAVNISPAHSSRKEHGEIKRGAADDQPSHLQNLRA